MPVEGPEKPLSGAEAPPPPAGGESFGAEFAAQMPAPSAPAAAAAPSSLVDAAGMPFDKALHLAKKDGTPAVHPKTGKLIRLPGKRIHPFQRAATPAPQQGPASNLDLGEGSAIEELNAIADEYDDDDEEGLELDQVGEDGLTEDERKAIAEDDAENVVELEEMLLGFGNPLDEAERLKLKGTMRRALLRDNVQLPIGNKVMHGVHFSKAFIRRAKTDEGKVNLKAVADFFRNIFGGSK